MLPHLVVALLLALLGAGCGRTPPSSPEKTPMAPKSPTPARVLTLPPSSGRAEYLVVLLHGVGASAESFLPIARALAPDVPHAEVVVLDGLHPFDGATTGRQWFSLQGITEQSRPARVRQAGAEVSAWIDGALAERDLGPERLVVVGFSQGAILAQWLALHRQPPPMAVVSLSGRLAEDAPAVADMTSVPVLLVHGARDAVMPARLSDEAARGLEARGARVRLRVLPTLAHGVDGEVLEETRWFLRDVLPHP
ncbi:alpha/beta fold hydrolase [Corallococcus sp. CA047B]|uniref:alpha/beta hydrolase n=1 Tax=Corallococcus sp. CA047B TaxID=2316729 RepID=UPI000EA3FFBC|nr:alpha/beta fold hydrolase [Corallococcus sp. CA047B]RKH14819.1 alpha/beta fold hydrolase [Corallococcus sp. CA047B]